MKYIRRIFLFIAASFLVTLLILVATFWTLNVTIGNRNTIKTWLASSGVYNNFIEQVIAVSTQEIEEESDQGSIDTEVLSRAATAAFPPEFLQSNLEKVIDGSYNWLEKETNTLEFSIDFSEAKQTLAASLGKEALLRAESLPACTSGEVPEEVDVFSAECLPRGADPQLLSNKFQQEILNSDKLLPDTTINAADVKIKQDGVETPVAEVLEHAPRWYGIVQSFVWIMLGLAVVAAGVVLLLSSTKREGLKHIAKSFGFAAFSIGIVAFIAQKIPLNIGETSEGGGVNGFAENILKPLIKQAIEGITGYQYWFTFIYAIIALALVLYLLLSNRKTRVSKQPLEAAPQKDELPTPEHLHEPKSNPEELSKTSSTSKDKAA